jgi:hypothetical protein
MSTTRSEGLGWARAMVTPGATQETAETEHYDSDHGEPPALASRVSRTSAAVGILIEVIERLSRDVDELQRELVEVRDGIRLELAGQRQVLIATLVLVSASTALGILTLILVVGALVLG